jgi:hypothetical protein
MQAVEALNILIEAGDRCAARLRDRLTADPENRFPGLLSEVDEQEIRQQSEAYSLASAVGQAMLNTALPVAKYRAFVEIDPEQPKRSKFQESVAVKYEFTICAVNMDGVISGLIGITGVPTNVKLTIWEQRANGADMLSGYQGQTKTGQYRKFLEGLRALETVNLTVQ